MSGADTYDVTIGEIAKNKSEKVVIRSGKFRGQPRVDLRIFGDYHDTGELRPTKKGLNLPVDRIPELIAALQSAAASEEAPAS